MEATYCQNHIIFLYLKMFIISWPSQISHILSPDIPIPWVLYHAHLYLGDLYNNWNSNNNTEPSTKLIWHQYTLIEAMQHLKRFYKDYPQWWIRDWWLNDSVNSLYNNSYLFLFLSHHMSKISANLISITLKIYPESLYLSWYSHVQGTIIPYL